MIGGRLWGRGWAWMTAGIQSAKSRLTEREGGRKKRAIEGEQGEGREREEDRLTDFIMQG